MPFTKIPKATTERIPVYNRHLSLLLNEGILRVSSDELANFTMIDSTTIRRDFSYFGTLGKRGYGYDVQKLVDFFDKLLNQGQIANVAIVGTRLFGTSLYKYKFMEGTKLQLVAAFVEDPSKITDKSLPVYSYKDFSIQIKEKRIKNIILDVSAKESQELTDTLSRFGVKGFLNLTPRRIRVPANVQVKSFDLEIELQTLVFNENSSSDPKFTLD